MVVYELSEGLRIALQAIAANKLRSLLTTLGVVIGIAFVILMGWFLKGLDTALEQTITMMGTDVLYVDKLDWAGGRKWSAMRNRKDITLQQADELIQRMTSAVAAVPSARQWNNTIKYGNNSLTAITVIGTNSAYASIAVGNITEGRFFSPVEDIYRTYVAVLGYNVANNLFPKGDAVGKTIKIKGIPFTVIGTLEKQGTLLIDFIDDQVYMPLRVFTSLYGTGKSMSIAIKAGSEDRLENVRLEATGLMRQIRNLPPGKEADFSINESKVFRDSLANIRLYVWAIGIGMTTLSFIVGIIGIMNIMFVSVTERTKEIGIRKALGARRRSILFQFLVEAATLCFIGALIAFAGCSLIILLTTRFIEQASFLTPYIPPDMLVIAGVVSFLVGILAGTLPAVRASHLDPVDALRFE